MNPFRSTPRRRRTLEFGPEPLESRELLTSGANTFAIIPGTVSKTGGTAQVQFTIDPKNFTLPKRAITMGIDIVADTGSNLKPLIASVDDPHGKVVAQTFHSIYDPHLSQLRVASGAGTSAVLSPLKLSPHDAGKPVTYVVNVKAEGNTSGGFLLGFYLPGDVNGDGVVNKTDLSLVKGLKGVRANNPKYDFNADANRDGRISSTDIAYTKQNQGVTTTVSAVVAANYDSSHDVGGLSSRVSTLPSAHFTGTATPGASITYAEVNNQVPSTTTTADSSGNYSITVPLANGPNTFGVTAKDSFGQTIQGNLSPVSYLDPSQTAVLTSLATSGSQQPQSDAQNK